MTLFNFTRWIAKEVTGPGDKDMKIYIIGPPGAGKSKTAIALALKIRKWLSWYLHKDFAHQEDYFKLDENHIAVISEEDLLRLMTDYPELYQIRIVDDCGNTKGFNCRQSMSTDNIDINSIWSTNRTRKGITIVTVHDTDFNDLRQVMLSNIVIDLRDYYQSGRFRMAKLYKIQMDDKKNGNRGVKKKRFMTYERGEWVTQESLACELPPDEYCKQYDALRAIKDKANTIRVREKIMAVTAKIEIEDNKPRCPQCNSKQVYRRENGAMKCKNCGLTY